jgi:hypothetical protein
MPEAERLMIESLPGKCKTLSSNLTTAKRKRQERY